jgi:hypothetical protein
MANPDSSVALREYLERLDLEKLEEDVQELQRAKANLDGRLVATAGVISVVVSAVLWALMQFFK